MIICDFAMAVSAVRIISSLNSRRIICSYRSPLTSQLRYLRDRLTPINVTNCSFLQLGQLRFSRIPERSTLCYLFLRWNSSSSASSGFQDDGNSALHYIPEPPSPPLSDTGSEIVEQLTALGEPTLQSLGLGSWYPNGLVQSGLEALHVGLNIPWWTSIVLGTVIVRLAIFPLFVFVQRNMVIMNNHMPTVQKLQDAFSKARRRGDLIEASRLGIKLQEYMKKNKVNPIKNAIGPLSQVPIFLSVFVGIRQMANLPVESMKTGGLAWFTDLTVPDPYFALPVMTVGMLYVTIEVGADGIRAGNMPKVSRIFIRVMPFVVLPFIMNFPAGLLCYWFTSNCVSLIQASFLKIPGIREALGIPHMMKQDTSTKKPIIQTLKDSWKDSHTIVDVESMQRMEATRFKEAGLGAVPKTYPYDPTKVQKTAAVKAKLQNS